MLESNRLARRIVRGRARAHSNIESGSAVLLLGLALRALLLWLYPALYGGDTVLHLRNHQRILLGHQLPMLQILIFVSYSVTTKPAVFRLVLIAIGALAGLGFYLLCLKRLSREAAFWSALFFVSNPFLNEISLVPFQEILMLGALAFAIHFYVERRIPAAAVLLGVACLTRYEAWIACPLFLFDYVNPARKQWRRLLTGVCLFGWAPALWIGFHFGLSAPGTYVLEWPASAARIVRWIYLAWIGAKNTPAPVVALALIGLALIYRDRLLRRRPVALFGIFAVLFLLAILSSAHGDPRPNSIDRERFVSSREATLPVGYLLLLAGIGFESLLSCREWRPLTRWLGCAVVALGCLQSALFLDQETSQPEIVLSYRLAKYLDVHVGAREKVLIVAKPFDLSDIGPSLIKAEKLDGGRGLAGARNVLRAIDLSPLSFQRTAVQMNLPSGQVLAAGDPAGVDWIAVWSDCGPKQDLEARLTLFKNIAKLRADRLQISIWRHL